MSTLNNHQGQLANRATRRAKKKSKPARAMPSPLLAALIAKASS